MVTLDDYVSESGFLGGEEAGVHSLRKAMTAGHITGRDTADQYLTQEPLKAESLDSTLKLLEFRTKDIKLWNAIPKLSAYNTVEEFLQLSSYGQMRGGFYNEGELSDVEDSQYIRRAELVKYMQVTGEVTMQAQMTKSFVNAMTKETENKVMWILRLANRSLTHADSSIIPQEFNSLYKQHASIGSGDGYLYSSFEDYYNSTTVVDLRGKSLTQEDVEKAAVKVDLNYGNVDTLFGPTTVISALGQNYYKDQRILMNEAFNGVIGTVPKAISTTMGDVALMSDKFMKQDDPKTTADSATSTKAPSAPASLAGALTADALSKYTVAEQGNVYFAVSAINSKGESALTAYGTAVNITAGQRVNLTITPSGGPNPTQGYIVYRTKVTAAGSPTGLQFFPIFKVSVAEVAAGTNGAGAGVIGDRGYFLPDTEKAFITEMSEEVMAFKQLAPISKLDLAVLSMSRRFITFLFGTPQLFAPKKKVVFINAGKIKNV